mmetsp:Transcript_85036/g.168755  ORF Transcript_85036/g.168755 Transcript_85036/m.168755 type:complete len:168 (-) Transcript_85036:76-579(-)
MNVLCKSLRCLSFLGGKKPPTDEYAPVDGQTVGKSNDTEDEDDFFGDSWGSSPSSDSLPSKQAEVKVQGVERNPSRETTTKRGAANATSASPTDRSTPQSKAGPGPKKETDLFAELGMEPEYKAPRILDPSKSRGKGQSVSSMLADGDAVDGEVGEGGWVTEDLDLT